MKDLGIKVKTKKLIWVVFSTKRDKILYFDNKSYVRGSVRLHVRLKMGRLQSNL